MTSHGVNSWLKVAVCMTGVVVIELATGSPSGTKLRVLRSPDYPSPNYEVHLDSIPPTSTGYGNATDEQEVIFNTTANFGYGTEPETVSNESRTRTTPMISQYEAIEYDPMLGWYTAATLCGLLAAFVICVGLDRLKQEAIDAWERRCERKRQLRSLTSALGGAPPARNAFNKNMAAYSATTAVQDGGNDDDDDRSTTCELTTSIFIGTTVASDALTTPEVEKPLPTTGKNETKPATSTDVDPFFGNKTTDVDQLSSLQVDQPKSQPTMASNVNIGNFIQKDDRARSSIDPADASINVWNDSGVDDVKTGRSIQPEVVSFSSEAIAVAALAESEIMFQHRTGLTGKPGDDDGSPPPTYDDANLDCERERRQLRHNLNELEASANELFVAQQQSAKGLVDEVLESAGFLFASGSDDSVTFADGGLPVSLANGQLSSVSCASAVNQDLIVFFDRWLRETIV